MPSKKRTSVGAKPTVKKRTLNPPGGSSKGNQGAPFQEQDPKRRLGNFESAGEHPRVGGRTSGIVGQTKQKFHRERKTK